MRGSEARLERDIGKAEGEEGREAATGGAGKRSGVITLLFLFLYFCGFLEIEKMLLARFANSRFIAYSAVVTVVVVVVATTQLRLQQEIHIHTRTHA